MPEDPPDREALTPTHNTGTFAVFADSSREWADKCREISKDATREMRVRLTAAGLGVRLGIAAELFRDWIDKPEKRPDVADRSTTVQAYQDLVSETVKFLSGLNGRPRK